MTVSEVLSQSEIDALLSALTSGEVKAEDIRDAGRSPRIRNYDFRRAMRFSKDHIRIISRIHEHFARLLTTHLSGQLRTMVQCQVESIDQVPYDEFIRSVPSLTVMQVMEFVPLEGNIVVEMNPQVVFAILDRLMGGAGTGPYRERELTEIEVVLVNKIFDGFSVFFADAWRNISDFQPRIVSMESNPQFLQLTTPSETVLVVTLSTRVGNTSGLMNVCIPHVTIEPVMPKLSAQYFMNVLRTKQSQESVDHISSQMQDVVVEASVTLGETELTVQELLDIQIGDIIPLEAPITQPVTVYIQGAPTYQASLGRMRDHLAVKILEPWKVVNRDDREHEAFTSRNRRAAE